MTTAIAEFGAANAESQQLVARQLAEIRHHGQLATEFAERVLAELSRNAPERIVALRARDAQLLNRMNAHDGYLAQAGVWINEPLSFGFDEGTVQLNDVNERIGELPYVFSATRDLSAAARILDVGCCESTVSISLASLGYRVTALDPRPYPFHHPMLTVETKPIERFVDDEGFDMIILLSTIEHLGVGAYGLDDLERLDLVAMRHLRTLLRPGARLVLTTPFGIPSVNSLERTYDVAGIRQLIAGFELVDEPTVLMRQSRTEWTTDPRGFADPLDDRQRVVMLTARGEA
jgi:2-polyprenyl-3-methyl-5-hydroxy-6-metoxy-1,4-benzoquinol methylase